jgi:DHA3 family multidrug efflux protein-like MFS transporter
VSAFIIGPLAQFWLIPFMESDAGRNALGWLLGDGEARGIALAFTAASLVLLIVVLLAFVSRPYRELSAAYAAAAPPEDGDKASGDRANEPAPDLDVDAIGASGRDLRASVR